MLARRKRQQNSFTELLLGRRETHDRERYCDSARIEHYYSSMTVDDVQGGEKKARVRRAEIERE